MGTVEAPGSFPVTFPVKSVEPRDFNVFILILTMFWTKSVNVP